MVRPVRRALLATLLCAAPLLAGPARAAGDLPERQPLRAALNHDAGAASARQVGRLPLPEPGAGRPAMASARSDLARIARGHGPQRVLIGVTRHSALPAVKRTLERLGAEPEAFDAIGVLAATVPSGAALVRALDGDPRVAYVERDSELRIAADPLDAVDPRTRIKYTWFYDHIRAGSALAAAGGGSSRSIAVIDTGLDIAHPEYAGRITHTLDTQTGDADVFDSVGHGTFVTGLIAGIDGNGIGGKGVAGNTQVLAIRASLTGRFTQPDLLRAIDFAIRRGADVLNMSLAGDSLGASVTRALANAFFSDVLPIAASGNTGRFGNRPQYPAALIGGRRGRPGIGLSVAATRPNGSVPRFSTHNRFVSLAAPGAGRRGCAHGLLSTLPANRASDWDDRRACARRVRDPSGARFAYGEGTSFAAALVSGIAALVWQVEPRLASEQVAEVLTRSARQTRGRGWNPFSGAGVVDGRAAAALARVYDITAPRVRARAARRGATVHVRLRPVRDRTEAGRELAGRVTYSLLVSRDGGDDFDIVVNRSRRPFRRAVPLRGERPNLILASVCDGNGNCGIRRLGRFRP
jgi:subtilisin family serine protease